MYLPPRCPQGALMLFYTARIALLKGDFTFVSGVNASTAWAHVVLAAKNLELTVSFSLQGPREVLGVYCSTGGVAPDPSPVLLGADVGLFLWIEMERSVSLRWPALQREQVVTGAAASTTSRLFSYLPIITFCIAPLLQAVYAFQKAAILSMLPEKEVTALGENVVELFRWGT